MKIKLVILFLVVSNFAWADTCAPFLKPSDTGFSTQEAFQNNKIWWFVASEAQSIQVHQNIIDSRLQTVVQRERDQKQSAWVLNIIDEDIDFRAHASAFGPPSDFTKELLKLAPSNFNLKGYDLTYEMIPEVSLNFFSAGNIIFPYPTAADGRLLDRVYIFQKEKLLRELTMSEYTAEMTPWPILTIYRQMNEEEYNQWQKNDEGAELIKKKQELHAQGNIATSFKVAGFYFSIQEAPLNFGKKTVKICLPRQELINLVKSKSAFFGFWDSLTEIYFLPESVPTLFKYKTTEP